MPSEPDPSLDTAIVMSILPPSVFEGSDPEGEGQDFQGGVGPCYAIQSVGAVTGAGITGRIEESNDGITWVAVTGAVFTEFDGEGVEVIKFTRTRRYLRWSSNYSPGEGDSVVVSAVAVQSVAD